MPATYAHDRFGSFVYERLSASKKMVIDRHRPLFDLGLHGPDLLFYYEPTKDHPVNKIGYAMHDRPGDEFFNHARKVIQTRTEDREAMMAYTFGFICHFALDALCHPFVENYVRLRNVSHTKIEVELDKYFLKMDVDNPFTYHRAKHIVPSKKDALIVAPFFEGVTPEEVLKAMRSFRLLDMVLTSSSSVKRHFLHFAMDVIKASSFKEQVMEVKDDERCVDSNKELDARFLQAIPNALMLIEEWDAHIDDDEPLNKAYEHTFSEN